MKNYPELINEFHKYVYDFYNDVSGVYKIASEARIYQAVNEYLESKPLGEIWFDSLDREYVRTIIEPEYKIV